MASTEKHQLSLKRRLRKAVYGPIGRTRDRLYAASPEWARQNLWPIVDYLDMFFIDHGIFRLFYANRFKLGDKAWRSAQPWPHQVRYYAKSKGIKTIVNLRGVRDCGSYRLEQAACEKHGINFVNFKMHSGRAPTIEEIETFKPFFEKLEYPILLHCKSGADRAGLAATLYAHLVDNQPFEQSMGQLHARFGHFKQAKTGVLDHFFDTYRKASNKEPIEFLDWVKTKYDAADVQRSFKANYWTNFWVEKILRRE